MPFKSWKVSQSDTRYMNYDLSGRLESSEWFSRVHLAVTIFRHLFVKLQGFTKIVSLICQERRRHSFRTSTIFSCRLGNRPGRHNLLLKLASKHHAALLVFSHHYAKRPPGMADGVTVISIGTHLVCQHWYTHCVMKKFADKVISCVVWRKNLYELHFIIVHAFLLHRLMVWIHTSFIFDQLKCQLVASGLVH